MSFKDDAKKVASSAVTTVGGLGMLFISAAYAVAEKITGKVICDSRSNPDNRPGVGF